jgi:hypothetical protein
MRDAIVFCGLSTRNAHGRVEQPDQKQKQDVSLGLMCLQYMVPAVTLRHSCVRLGLHIDNPVLASCMAVQVPRFLNRLLGLQVVDQQLLFEVKAKTIG